MRIAVSVQKANMTLKRPILSPKIPGKVRPNIEPAFRIETRYCARSRDIPRPAATAVIYDMTGNMPKYMKNRDTVRRIIGTSLRGRMKAMMLQGRRFGGRRERSVAMAKMHSANTRNAHVRIAQ